MDLKYLIKDIIRLRNIILVSIISIILNYFYYHNILSINKVVEGKKILQLYFGGIFASESYKIIEVIIYIIPITLIVMLGINIVREFKENYVYIFTRTRSFRHWFEKILVKDMYYITLFLFLSLIILWLFEGQAIHLKLFLCLYTFKILLMYWLQYLIIILFTQVLFFYTKEEITTIITLSFVSIPVIITGIFYKEGSNLLKLCRYFIFNRGIYNYHEGCILNSSNNNFIIECESLKNMNLYISLLWQVIIIVMLYFIGIHKLKKIELL